MEGRDIRRGDIYLCDFGEPLGHEPGFRRPALVLSAAPLNQHGVPIVVPITSKRRDYPSHVEIDGPLPEPSYIQCELLGVVAVDRLIRRLGTVDSPTMAQVERIVRRLLVL
ncbi:MAG: type II toxin-antitoxin system PemK/MazF family toxin [Propionibacteriaceae bacterium]|nr:type II toxin-antitoxin system PemK/MazF family toxin [Propionibacteriaceae bacterium]